jgi:hypothetical protein
LRVRLAGGLLGVVPGSVAIASASRFLPAGGYGDE